MTFSPKGKKPFVFFKNQGFTVLLMWSTPRPYSEMGHFPLSLCWGGSNSMTLEIWRWGLEGVAALGQKSIMGCRL